ncbi:Eukaryotic_translation initiation factor 4E [Hexamita inflata]|uniref:Eukaryotic translation initiation factor 4E n=1 Tax=Hexamita inflata TaxID=28002 RepID=A0AA86U3H6_9EUKA|nr:Eukaryotic translation initiation factor 4E [Hexamita inflata]
MLKHEWRWQLLVKLIKNFTLSNFRESYLQIGTQTNDIETLLRLKNNFNPIRDLKNCNITLFKDSIQPVWEDPRNMKGATISLRTKLNEDIFDWFISYVLANEDDLNGCYVKVHPDYTIFQIWFANLQQQQLIEADLRKILDGEPDIRIETQKERKNGYATPRTRDTNTESNRSFDKSEKEYSQRRFTRGED